MQGEQVLRKRSREVAIQQFRVAMKIETVEDY